MKKAVLVLVLMYLSFNGFTQIREDILAIDTLDKVLIVGQVRNAGWYYTFTDEGMILYVNKIVGMPSANQVLRIKAEQIFYHKDSIPEIYNLMETWRLDNIQPMLVDTVVNMEIDWQEVLYDKPD